MITDPKLVSNKFNHEYATAAYKLTKTLQTNGNEFLTHMSGSQYKRENSIFMHTSVNEIIKLTKKLKNKHSSGVDNIPISLLKKCISGIVHPLENIFDSCLEKGIFLRKLKRSKIIPVL